MNLDSVAVSIISTLESPSSILSTNPVPELEPLSDAVILIMKQRA